MMRSQYYDTPRTPLNGIIGYSEILLEDFEDDIEESHAEDINHTGSCERS